MSRQNTCVLAGLSFLSLSLLLNCLNPTHIPCVSNQHDYPRTTDHTRLEGLRQTKYVEVLCKTSLTMYMYSNIFRFSFSRIIMLEVLSLGIRMLPKTGKHPLLAQGFPTSSVLGRDLSLPSDSPATFLPPPIVSKTAPQTLSGKTSFGVSPRWIFIPYTSQDGWTPHSPSQNILTKTSSHCYIPGPGQNFHGKKILIFFPGQPCMTMKSFTGYALPGDRFSVCAKLPVHTQNQEMGLPQIIHHKLIN